MQDPECVSPNVSICHKRCLDRYFGASLSNSSLGLSNKRSFASHFEFMHSLSGSTYIYENKKKVAPISRHFLLYIREFFISSPVPRCIIDTQIVELQLLDRVSHNLHTRSGKFYDCNIRIRKNFISSKLLRQLYFIWHE